MSLFFIQDYSSLDAPNSNDVTTQLLRAVFTDRMNDLRQDLASAVTRIRFVSQLYSDSIRLRLLRCRSLVEECMAIESGARDEHLSSVEIPPSMTVAPSDATEIVKGLKSPVAQRASSPQPPLPRPPTSPPRAQSASPSRSAISAEPSVEEPKVQEEPTSVLEDIEMVPPYTSESEHEKEDAMEGQLSPTHFNRCD